MTLIFLLIFIALILFFGELLVPGGVLGIIGGVLLVIATVLGFMEGAEVGVFVFLFAAVSSVALLYVELKLLQNTTLGKRFFLQSSIDGTSQDPVGQSDLVGKEGETLTHLSPTGLILVDGKKYEAFSQSGVLNKGTKIKVTAVESFRVTVRKS
ncbi:MAG: NfeD family protein [Opitutales bacterium]|nr:NfeD family protein [Opitutales bacterium]MCH8540988.1 NfeD family protein [Opitutales bacterium]